MDNHVIAAGVPIVFSVLINLRLHMPTLTEGGAKEQEIHAQKTWGTVDSAKKAYRCRAALRRYC